MDDYSASTYGDRIAGVYDDWYGPPTPDDGSIDLLASLAGPGPALELAIGTGRIALPLAERGVEVHGIDASDEMLAKLRGKPGAETIASTVGDFADVPVLGRFTLIYVVFNTFFALLTQDDQTRCFRNVGEHLADRGSFLIEAFVPDPSLFAQGGRLHAASVTGEKVRIDAGRLDAATQRVSTSHVVIGEAGTRIYPVELRYAWPSELDLMARLAGLHLRDRWGGWKQEPFTGEGKHVSVYAPD